MLRRIIHIAGRAGQVTALILACWAPAFAEGPHSPENPSLLLFAGGAAIFAWRYLRSRTR